MGSSDTIVSFRSRGERPVGDSGNPSPGDMVPSVVVLFFVSVATFLLMHAVPGGPLVAVIGERQADGPEIWRQRSRSALRWTSRFLFSTCSYVRNMSSTATSAPTSQPSNRWPTSSGSSSLYIELGI